MLIIALKDLVKSEPAEVSALADNIASFRFEREDDEMERRITILKQRGLPHHKGVRYIDFKEGRVVIHG